MKINSYFIVDGEITKNSLAYSGISEVLKKVFIENDGKNPFSYIGIGLGKSPPTKFDTELEFEIARQLGRFHYIPMSNNFYIDSTFPSGDVEGRISEVGVFNKESFGTLLARAILHPSKFKAKTKSFPIYWRFNFE